MNFRQIKENKMKSFKETMFAEKAKELSDKEYEKFFNEMLKKYKVKGIEDLDEKQKKKFFNEIDKAIKAKKETD